MDLLGSSFCQHPFDYIGNIEHHFHELVQSDLLFIRQCKFQAHPKNYTHPRVLQQDIENAIDLCSSYRIGRQANDEKSIAPYIESGI